jgi:O-antigen/teichoic acid export membrane protein
VGSISALSISLVFLCLSLRNKGQFQDLGIFNRKAMVRFSAYNYFALLGYQLYGFDTLKLLVTKIVGVAETAAYGLAQSLADIMRRYLPAQLLLGMIRPLIIASYSESRSMDRPLFLANLILKLNIFLVAPALAVFISVGEPLLALIGKGRYPQAYGYVLAFLLLVVIQTLHLMLAVLATTIERSDLVMRATWLAMAGTVVAILVIPYAGAWGALAAAYVSEFGYCYAVMRGLRTVCRQPIVYWQSYRPLLAAFAAAVAVAIIASRLLPATDTVTIATAMFTTLCFLAAAYVWKPFTPKESDLINKMLPKPVFIW